MIFSNSPSKQESSTTDTTSPSNPSETDHTKIRPKSPLHDSAMPRGDKTVGKKEKPPFSKENAAKTARFNTNKKATVFKSDSSGTKTVKPSQRKHPLLERMGSKK